MATFTRVHGPSASRGRIPRLVANELLLAWIVACSSPHRGGIEPVFVHSAGLVGVIIDLVEAAPTPVTEQATARVRAASRIDPSAGGVAVTQLIALGSVAHAAIRTATAGAPSQALEDVMADALEEVLEIAIGSVFEELAQVGLVDERTGLSNRHALDRDLGRDLARAKAHDLSMAVIVVIVEDGRDATSGSRAVPGEVMLATAAMLTGHDARSAVYWWGGADVVVVCTDLEPHAVRELMSRGAAGTRAWFTWGCAWLKEAADHSAPDARGLLRCAAAQARAYRASAGGIDDHAIRRTGVGRSGAVFAGQICVGLRREIVIEQSIGVIAQVLGCSVEDAAADLRVLADERAEPIAVTAAAILDRELDVRPSFARHADRSPSGMIGDHGPDPTV